MIGVTDEYGKAGWAWLGVRLAPLAGVMRLMRINRDAATMETGRLTGDVTLHPPEMPFIEHDCKERLKGSETAFGARVFRHAGTGNYSGTPYKNALGTVNRDGNEMVCRTIWPLTLYRPGDRDA